MSVVCIYIIRTYLPTPRCASVAKTFFPFSLASKTASNERREAARAAAHLPLPYIVKLHDIRTYKRPFSFVSGLALSGAIQGESRDKKKKSATIYIIFAHAR